MQGAVILQEAQKFARLPSISRQKEVLLPGQLSSWQPYLVPVVKHPVLAHQEYPLIIKICNICMGDKWQFKFRILKYEYVI